MYFTPVGKMAVVLLILTGRLHSQVQPKLADAQALGFVVPCGTTLNATTNSTQTSSASDNEEGMIAELNIGRNHDWAFVNFICDEERALWFKGPRDTSFKKIATYDRVLFLVPNETGEWVFFDCGPGSGESNAFLLPLSSFTQGKRKPAPKLPGSNVTFRDIDPSGYVNLAGLYMPLVPRQFDGRVGISNFKWTDEDTVEFEIEARNGDENKAWQGKFTYNARTRAISKTEFPARK
jgi:hypothetical protein